MGVTWRGDKGQTKERENEDEPLLSKKVNKIPEINSNAATCTVVYLLNVCVKAETARTESHRQQSAAVHAG